MQTMRMNDSNRYPKPRYVPPRNALTELALCVPKDLLAIFKTVRKEVEKENPIGTWPDVPYHYGMGKIQAYSQWLRHLTEEERKAQLRHSRRTYEAYFRKCADLILAKMAGRNIDLSPYIAEHRKQQRRRLRILEISRQADDAGPTLGGGRKR